jgi:hypothetical protein
MRSGNLPRNGSRPVASPRAKTDYVSNRRAGTDNHRCLRIIRADERTARHQIQRGEGHGKACHSEIVGAVADGCLPGTDQPDEGLGHDHEKGDKGQRTRRSDNSTHGDRRVDRTVIGCPDPLRYQADGPAGDAAAKDKR